MHHQILAPVATQKRIQTIDIIRGFALLGILTIGFTVDHGCYAPLDSYPGQSNQKTMNPLATKKVFTVSMM